MIYRDEINQIKLTNSLTYQTIRIVYFQNEVEIKMYQNLFCLSENTLLFCYNDKC
jgi:hypothetical protein